MSTLALRLACLAAVLLAATEASGRLRAQDTIRPVPARSAAAPHVQRHTRSPADTASPHTETKGRTAAKSLSQRIFDTPWVLFPTRLTVVIVLLAVSALFLMSGCWGAVRFAHLLRHLEWKEPPPRIKRGEFGAAGASLAFEFEQRLNTKREEDEERDRQIAWLRTAVLRLTADHNRTAATLALIDQIGRESRSHEPTDGVG